MIRSLTQAWSSVRGGTTVKGRDGGEADECRRVEDERSLGVEFADRLVAAAFPLAFFDEPPGTDNARIS